MPSNSRSCRRPSSRRSRGVGFYGHFQGIWRGDYGSIEAVAAIFLPPGRNRIWRGNEQRKSH